MGETPQIAKAQWCRGLPKCSSQTFSCDKFQIQIGLLAHWHVEAASVSRVISIDLYNFAFQSFDRFAVTGVTSSSLSYETDIHVPYYIRGPGVSTGVRTEIVSNVDLLPTFLDLAGHPVGTAVDGRSFAPILRGEQPTNWRDHILIEYGSIGRVLIFVLLLALFCLDA